MIEKKIILAAALFLSVATCFSQTLFEKSFGSGSDDDWFWGIQPTPSDSGFIVIGQASGAFSGSGGILVVKTNKNGDTLWTKIYGGSHADFGYRIAPTSDNGFIFGGFTNSFGTSVGTNSDDYIIKINNQGDTLWTKVIGTAVGDEAIHSIIEASDSGYVGTGHCH